MGGHGGYGPALTPIGKISRDDALDASGQYDASGNYEHTRGILVDDLRRPRQFNDLPRSNDVNLAAT